MSKGEQTRQRIVARAAPVFNMRGFQGTSMADLTKATGLEKGGIYNHFPSKEALALAAFDHSVGVVSQIFREVLVDKEHAIDRLLAILSVFRRYTDDSLVPGGCPVLNTAIEADDTAPVFRERAQAAMTGWHKLIGKTVKEGVARGELRPDTDPYMVASLVTSMLEGAVMLSKLYGDPIHMQRALAHLTDYVQSLAVEG